MSRAILDKAQTEDELLQAVTDALTLYGYRWVHFRRSDKAQMMGHAGWPDVFAVKKGRFMFLELKRQDGRLSEPQKAWSRELFPNWMVIRPADLDWLLERLR